MLFWSNIMQWVNHLLVLHKFRSRIAWFERDRWSFVLYSCGGYHGNAQRLFAVQTRSARGTPALQALRWDVPSGPGYMISTDTDTNTLARSGAQCNEMLVISCCGVVCLMSPAVKKRKEKKLGRCPAVQFSPWDMNLRGPLLCWVHKGWLMVLAADVCLLAVRAKSLLITSCRFKANL